MQHERDEQVIYIKDLIFAALYQWRKILIVALVFALLLGGYKFAAGVNALNGVVSVAEEDVKLAALQKDIDLQMEYLNDSVLMNLDPYRVCKATADINILAEPFATNDTTQTSSYIGSLLNGYSSILLSQLNTEAVITAAGIDSWYLEELVTISSQIHGTSDGVVTVTVAHSDSAVADSILTALTDAIPDISERLEQSVAPHTVNCYTSSTVQVDTELATQQSAELKRLEDLQQSYQQKATIGSSLVGDMSYTSVLKSAIIFAVIGGILGVILTVGVIWVAHFCSTKVYSSRTLQAWTGIKVLGCTAVADRKNPIDRWLRKLEGRADAAQLPVTAATVKNYCKDSEQLLVCTGADCPEELKKALSDSHVGIIVCGSFLSDVTAVAALPGCSKVLLVAECGKTHYRDIALQMQLIRDQEKMLIGAIVLDS